MFSIFTAITLLLPALTLADGLAKPAVDNCAAYPGLNSDLAKCKTVTSFCESVLGRGPKTVTATYATYTTTVPVTSPYSEVSSTTITRSTTVPFFTHTATSTILECPSATAPPAVVRPDGAVVTKVAAAAATSCGVGQFKEKWISTACKCEIDSTVIVASKTVTKMQGTTFALTSSTATSYTTHTSYKATTTATATRHDANCSPPAFAGCKGPTNCTADPPFYESFLCGSGGTGYDCICGFDAHSQADCYKADFRCETAPICTYDYDCDDGYFCLYGGFDMYGNCCSGGVCAMADVCEGDQT